MRLLVGCEFSGVIRDAFRDAGHEAWSCDLLGPEDRPEDFRAQRWGNYHLQGDVRWFLDGSRGPCQRWDCFIAHPDCTYVSVSGSHWIGRQRRATGSHERMMQAEQALAFFNELLWAPIPRICLENPIGLLNRWVRKPDQIVQPYQFGDDASKATCLWLVNLPELVIPPRAQWCPGRLVGTPLGTHVERWANQTDSGQNRLSPSPDRWALRATTYPGIAAAMVRGWSNLPEHP